jgi:predicted transcriptional regulator of viral defense system
MQPKSARAFLSYNASRGNLNRIKRGIYILSDNQPTKFEIANYLCKPSYLSFETALSYYGIIPETVYAITSATTNKNAKEVNFEDQVYQYRKIKKGLFFGYQPVKIRDRLVLIADREKALLDYLYLLSLKNGQLNGRMDLSKIDKQKLGRYVNYFMRFIRKNRALINLLKEINL